MCQESKLLGLYPDDKLQVTWKESLPDGTNKDDAINQFKKILNEARGKLDTGIADVREKPIPANYSGGPEVATDEAKEDIEQDQEEYPKWR